jgi:dUTP pyrophosphatase
MDATGKPALSIGVKRLPHGGGLPLPSYESSGAAGMDLRAAVPDGQPLVLEPGGRAAVPTGLALAIPAGFEAQVRPRSGLALKHGLTCLNSPGTIDSDYRGEVKVILANFGEAAVTLHRGDRIAQMVIAPVTRVALSELDELGDTQRGESGFGSTGRA